MTHTLPVHLSTTDIPMRILSLTSGMKTKQNIEVIPYSLIRTIYNLKCLIIYNMSVCITTLEDIRTWMQKFQGSTITENSESNKELLTDSSNRKEYKSRGVKVIFSSRIFPPASLALPYIVSPFLRLWRLHCLAGIRKLILEEVRASLHL